MGLKIRFFSKRSKELKFLNTLGACELKFGAKLGCRAEKCYNF